jgi:hypothetical protein
MAKEVAITAIIDKDSRDKLCPESDDCQDPSENQYASFLDWTIIYCLLIINKTMIQKHKKFQLSHNVPDPTSLASKIEH